MLRQVVVQGALTLCLLLEFTPGRGSSRGVLKDFGNMSSATLMFVLQRILAGAQPGNGLAMAFGPGLACETFTFKKL